MPDRARRIAAALLLITGTSLAAAAARWLAVRGKDLSHRPPPSPGLIAFGVCVALAFAAGRFAGRCPRKTAVIPETGLVTLPPWRTAGASAAGIVAALLSARVWALQGPPPVPLSAAGFWVAALLAAAVAFALAGQARLVKQRPRRLPPGIAAALLAVIALGAWCRLGALDRVPAAFGGDEASQVADGIDLWRGGTGTDPFGTGWGGAFRLGMLPAGLGAIGSKDPIAGPRRPYAVAGVLSLAAAAAVGGLVAGPWGALATAALLAFAPHHVHFSRLASVMVLDSLLAMTCLWLALKVFETGSPLLGFLAGATAGLSLYGYAGGRVVPVVFLVASPWLIFAPAARGRRALLAVALGVGIALAAAPNLRFAAAHAASWNDRFTQTAIFRSGWWEPKLKELGSPTAILESQFLSGTIGLLSVPSRYPWFTGYPLVAPFFLPALAAAGLGWLVGRGRIFEALLPALLVAGNLTAVILTDSTPAPQRLSSLLPAMAVLGGAAVAGLLGLLARSERPGIAWRPIAGSLVVGAILVGAFRGLPPWWDPSPRYGASHAAFFRSAAEVLRMPRYRGEALFFHGRPYVDSNFPTCRYLLPGIPWVERDPSEEGKCLEPGIHVFSPEWVAYAREQAARCGVPRVVLLPDPWDPLLDIGCIVRAR